MHFTSTSSDVCKIVAHCTRGAYVVHVEYTNIRVPIDVWERCKETAKTLKKSANATAVECISDCLDEMGKAEPGVPKIARLHQLMNEGKKTKK